MYYLPPGQTARVDIDVQLRAAGWGGQRKVDRFPDAQCHGVTVVQRAFSQGLKRIIDTLNEGLATWSLISHIREI
jgi:hypothetical protein